MPSTLELEVDYREKKLIDLLNLANNSRLDKIKITTPNLKVGDIILKYQYISKTKEETHYKMIIERKSVSDLMSSIKDGRYKEQKMRIKSCQTQDLKNGIKCQFFYLIEGNVNTVKFRKKQNSKGIYGSWISMLFRDDIKMIRTWDLEETSIFIMRLVDRVLKNAKELWSSCYIPIVASENIPQEKQNTQDTQYKQNTQEINNNIVSIDETSTSIKKITLHLDRKTNKLKTNNVKIIKGGSNKEDTSTTDLNITSQEETLLPNKSDDKIKPIKLTPSHQDRKTSVSPTELELEKEEISSLQSNVDAELEKEYLSTFSIKTKKSENLTPNACQKIMLSVIPGMSCGISIQILERFGNISALLDWLKIDFNTSLKLLLDNMSFLRKMKKLHLNTYRILKDNVMKNDDFLIKDITEITFISYLNTLENIKKDEISSHLDVLSEYFIMMKKKELAEFKIKVKSNSKEDTEEKERKLGPSLAEKIYSYLIN
jgi:ERCC4-type nuclease